MLIRVEVERKDLEKILNEVQRDLHQQCGCALWVCGFLWSLSLAAQEPKFCTSCGESCSLL